MVNDDIVSEKNKKEDQKQNETAFFNTGTKEGKLYSCILHWSKHTFITKYIHCKVHSVLFHLNLCFLIENPKRNIIAHFMFGPREESILLFLLWINARSRNLYC